MSRSTLAVDDRLLDYLRTVSVREPAMLARLREETAALPSAAMQISPEQGQFMALLARLTGARRYLEIGTFTGYSALAVVLAMPPDGRAVALDVSEEWTAVARRYWREAGVDGRIDLRLAPAAESLEALRAADTEPFDLAFIDADKTGYEAYYEHALALVRPGGLVMIDNVLWGGRVADPEAGDADTVALRELNARLADDARVDLAMLPVGDGLTLARRRSGS